MGPKLVVALNAALVLAGVAAAAAAPKTNTVLVVTWPDAVSRSAVAVIVEAGGQLVGATGRNWAMFARGNDPDFVDRLYAEGALVVLEGGMWSGCLNQGGA